MVIVSINVPVAMADWGTETGDKIDIYFDHRVHVRAPEIVPESNKTNRTMTLV